MVAAVATHLSTEKQKTGENCKENTKYEDRLDKDSFREEVGDGDWFSHKKGGKRLNWQSGAAE